MGVHIGATWLMRLNRPCSGGPNEEAAIRSCVKLLTPLVIIIIVVIKKQQSSRRRRRRRQSTVQTAARYELS